MLQKYFKHGDKKSAIKARFSSKVGVSASIEYQLGMTDANGVERSFAPIVLRGDVETYTEVTLNGNFKNEYTAGVLRFVEKDIEMEKLQDIMEGHEKMTFPGLEPHQYTSLWILHKDKDGIELHFNYGKEELTTGKKLRPFVADIDMERMDAFKNYINAKYNFADPNDPKYKQDYAISDNKLPADIEDVKGHIDQYISRMIDADLVYDRQSLVEALNGHEGVNVSRETKKAVSIEVKGRARPIRLKGQVYEEDFTKDKLTDDYKASISDRYQEERPMRLEEEYEKAMKLHDERAKENKEYYRIHPVKLLKAKLEVEVEELILEGKVSKRSEIADYIRQDEQVEEVREDVKHHLSVKMEGRNKPFRLDSEFFKRDFDIPAYRESVNSEKGEEPSIDSNNEPENKLRDEEEQYLKEKREKENQPQYYFENEYNSTNFKKMVDGRWQDVANNIDDFLNTNEQLNENYDIIGNNEENEITDFDLSMFKSYSDNIKTKVESKGLENNNNKEKEYGRESDEERYRRVIQKVTQRSRRERTGFFGIVGKIIDRASGRKEDQRRINEAISRNREEVERSRRATDRNSSHIRQITETLRVNQGEPDTDSKNFGKSLSKLENYVAKQRMQLNEDRKQDLKKRTKELSFN